MNYAGILLYVLVIISIMVLGFVAVLKISDYLKRKSATGHKSLIPMSFEVKLSDKQSAGSNEFKVIVQASSEADAVRKAREKYKHIEGIFVLSVKQL